MFTNNALYLFAVPIVFIYIIWVTSTVPTLDQALKFQWGGLCTRNMPFVVPVITTFAELGFKFNS